MKFTVAQLKEQIQELMRELAINGMNMRRMIRINNTREVENLGAARTEILKSIVHRQGLIIEILTQEIEYKEVA